VSELSDLVKLAKNDPDAAAKKLLPILQEIFPDHAITACNINSGSKVSLNSVNGILTAQDGKRFFYKFHAEEGEKDTLAGREYYQAQMLESRGWPVLKPLAISTAPGRQCLLYNELKAPTAYELFGEADAKYLETGAYDQTQYDALLKAEENYLKKTAKIILETMRPGDVESKNALVHQLFSHRLNGMNGSTPRLDLFYTGHNVTLPDGTKLPFDELAKKKWVINGVEQPHTLAEIIAASRRYLAHTNMTMQPTAICHGDDHNGNKFLVDGEFITFDPAFAGRPPVLLGLIKGPMHNGPLHPFWYYEPERVLPKLNVDFKIEADKIIINHNGAAVLKSPLRDAVLQLHAEHVWKPVLMTLLEKRLLWKEWKDFVRCAAFCCPFLAINMINPDRAPSPGAAPYDSKLPLFNLAQCVDIYHHTGDSLMPRGLKSA
jgi:hypothetical protein